MTLCNHLYINKCNCNCKWYQSMIWHQPLTIPVQETISSCADKKYANRKREQSDRDWLIIVFLSLSLSSHWLGRVQENPGSKKRGLNDVGYQTEHIWRQKIILMGKFWTEGEYYRKSCFLDFIS